METIVRIFVAIIWAIVGLIVWIPIAFRIMMIYIFNIFKITILEKDLPIENYSKLLIDTGSIYIIGFKNIFSKEDELRIPRTKKTRNEYYVIYEIFWALIFWGSITLPIIFRFIR